MLVTMFCPSRGRPQAARELLESFERTRKTSLVSLIFLVDSDDPTKDDYPVAYTRIGVPTGDPTGPLNVAALASEDDAVGFMGDDSRFETDGWDVMVLEALKNSSFVWGDDGHERPWPTTVFISTPIVKALGYMVPPTLRRGYFDVAWIELANATKTTRVIPAMFRHDNSAGDVNSPNCKPEAVVPPAIIASDERAFHWWRENDLKKDVRLIRHAIYS